MSPCLAFKHLLGNNYRSGMASCAVPIYGRLLLRKSSVFEKFFRGAKGDTDKFTAEERKATLIFRTCSGKLIGASGGAAPKRGSLRWT